jgi:2-polyprenyl-6-methoxyphenol hydroxylase-like FAD-dependent oxidoreductase
MAIPVLIVGAGPVGLTMASELARYGIPVRIIDKAAHRTDKSKALVVWSRTLELLDRGGGSAPFIDAGFKTDGRYRVIADLPMTDQAHPKTPTREEVQAIIDRRGPSGTKIHDPI